MSCYHPEDGGFGASPRNDSHLLSTLSALQILALLDQLDRADTDAVAACGRIWGLLYTLDVFSVLSIGAEQQHSWLYLHLNTRSRALACACCQRFHAACCCTHRACNEAGSWLTLLLKAMHCGLCLFAHVPCRHVRTAAA